MFKVGGPSEEWFGADGLRWSAALAEYVVMTALRGLADEVATGLAVSR